MKKPRFRKCRVRINSGADVRGYQRGNLFCYRDGDDGTWTVEEGADPMSATTGVLKLHLVGVTRAVAVDAVRTGNWQRHKFGVAS